MAESDDDAVSAPATGREVVTVFRSTLRPEAVEEYESVSERMVALARTMPGFSTTRPSPPTTASG